MGAQQSNTKSSLLKNFTYMIGQDNTTGGPKRPQYKLMYFDYLNFLNYEIDHEAWKWKIYKRNVTGGGGTLTEDQRLFCGWKQIQKKIFDKLNEQLQLARPPTQRKYKWEDDALPLINIKENKLGITQDCNQISIKDNDIKELQNAKFPGLSGGTSSTNCPGINTAPNLHIPLRRRALLVEGIDQYMQEINDEIMKPETLKKVIQSNVNAQSHIGELAVELKKNMIDGLGTGLSNLINDKYKDTEHKAFCNEWQRTMEDYHTLFLGDDIVDEDETKKIQCRIKLIEQKAKDSTNFKKGWSKHFKNLVKDLQKNHLKDPKTRNTCQISYENKTQCVRFFEEWAEEFCLLKRDLGQMLVDECGGGSTPNVNCNNLCSIYKKFLDESKPYFDTYMSTCVKPEYGYKQTKTELQDSFIKAANNSMNECCKDYGDCNQTELFEVTNDKSNIRYKCFCENGGYYTKRDNEPKCQKLLTKPAMTQGTPVSASSLPGAGIQNPGPTSGTASPQTVMEIAQEVQQKAHEEAKTRAGDSLKGSIENAKFKNNETGKNLKDNICDIDKQKHTNDVRTYRDSSNLNGNQHRGPCTGKGGNNPDRFVIGKKWEQDKGKVSAGNDDILLPPRRRDMCTSNLENLAASGGTPELLTRGNVNDSFTGDVLLAAKEEASNILQLYGNSNDQSGMCRAVRASFADLGDIIRGKDIWEKNDDMKRLQDHLGKIFAKIKEEKGNGKYNTDTEPYTQLRSDWWSANRDQVWEAMKCVVQDLVATTETYSGKGGVSGTASAFCGYNTEVPVDDYIPQKLRWLTEWNESYCKQMKKDFNAVREVCNKCKNSGDCDKNNDNCDMCSGMCTVYGEHVKDWKNQWNKQKDKYNQLYSSSAGNEKDFFDKLKGISGTGKNYSNPEDFVESMGGYRYCKDTQQREIKNESKEDYIFKDKPKDYQEECKCKDKDTSPPAGPAPTAPKTPTKSPEIEKCQDAFNGSNASGQQKVDLSDWDCIQDNDMCINKNSTTHNISNYSKQFETIFEEWLDSFFKEQKNVKEKSDDCTTLTSNSSECDNKKCNQKCPCYEKWVKRKNQEWKHFRKFYGEFQIINPSLSTSLFKKGKNADEYVKNKKTTEISEYKSSNSTLKSSTNVTINQILQHENTKVSTCLKNCPIKIPCKDKGFGNHWNCDNTKSGTAAGGKDNMCIKKEEDDQPSGGGTRAPQQQKNSDTTETFYNLFNEWLHDMEQMLGTGKTLVERACSGSTSGGGASVKPGASGTPGSSGEKDCKECKELCGCYEELRKEIEKQWGNQTTNYNHHKGNTKDEEMKDLELDIYLNAQCILNESVKSEKTQSIQTEDYDNSYEICEKRKGTKDNYVQALIDKSKEDKTKLCDECKDYQKQKTQTDGCDNIGNATDCQKKDYDELKYASKNNNERKKEWSCKTNDKNSEIHKHVCVPPRTQPLCIANMYDSGKRTLKLTNSEPELKNKLKEAIKKETSLLYEYYKQKNSSTTTPGTPTNQVPPPGFCEAAYRSFNDFKHMVIGDMLWEPTSIKDVQNKIGEIIKTTIPSSSTSGKSATPEDREKWWKSNEKDFWEAVKCGIEEANKQNGVPTSGGNHCARLITEDDQFEWWAKEWSDDFYHKRNEVLKDFDTKCKTDNNGKNKDCENGNMKAGSECNPKCEEYKKFLQKKRSEWTENFRKYLKEQETKNPDKYSDEIFYLLNPCTYQSCDNKYITALLNGKTYGDKQKLCACDAESQKPDETNPCSVNFTEYGCTEKKYRDIWSTVSVRHQTDRGKVYAPPRRNSMCIGWLFSPIIGGKHDTSGTKPSGMNKDRAKNLLKEKLINAAKGESHYLYKYYEKNNGITGGSDSKYCSALRRSFYDYGDMVQGTDLWNAGYSSLVEKNIHEVFAMKESGSTTGPSEDEIVADRQGWWEVNKQYVWQAMRCPTSQCSVELPTDYDSHDQFLRWFIEWGEHFCEEKKKYMETLRIKCLVDPCDSMCAGTTCPPCQKQCAKYHNWLLTKKNEWNGQKSKYTEEYKKRKENHGKYAGTKERPHKYLTTNATICKDEDFTKLFKRHDDKYKPYKQKCKRCIDELTQDVVDKIKTKNGGTSTRKTNIFWLCKGNCDVNNTNLYKEHVEKDKDYGKIKGQGNCKGLKSAAEETQQGKGIKWKNNEDTEFSHLKTGPNYQKDPVSEQIYIPPRKQKICFHGLDGKYEGKDNDVKDKDKLFEYLLKVASIEGYNLGEYYKDKETNKTGKNADNYAYEVSPCSAMKYSFLDLRDLIIGHDMLEPDTTDTGKKIKEIIGNGNTTDIDKKRKDFWNQNKDCVWKAMLCGYKKSGGDTLTNCDTNPPSDKDFPLGDDRPSGTAHQFLRWFAEWGEDFCKKHHVEKEKLESACNKCTDVVKCTGCEECTKQCQKYKAFIENWKAQYNKQKTKYDTLKGENPYKTLDEVKNSDHAYEYLDKSLKKSCPNSGNPGPTSGTNDCNCMKDPSTQQPNSGVIPQSLEYPPSGYKDKCDCNTSSAAKPAPVKPAANNICDDVKKHIENNDSRKKSSGGGCSKKNFDTKSWDCTNKSVDTTKYDGACMSPRRQSLCIFYLKEKSFKDKNELKEALIKSASLETYRLWEKYKSDHPGEEQKLKTSSTIPEEFKRIMFYTFGDLKDLILDTDISTKDQQKNPHVVAARQKITEAFTKSGKSKPTDRQTWWNSVATEVWDAMVCALSYNGKNMDTNIRDALKQNNNNTYEKVKFSDTTTSSGNNGLAAFASRPQFLRWLTEWGEQYCREYNREYQDLVRECKTCTDPATCGPECDKCKAQCTKYQGWLTTWKNNYNSQKGKYDKVKGEQIYKDADTDVENSSDARDYLNKKLQNMKCTKNATTKSCDYTCMDNASTKSSSSPPLPVSMEYPPKDYENKCNCKPSGGGAQHSSTPTPLQPSTTVDNGQGPKAPDQGTKGGKDAGQPGQKPGEPNPGLSPGSAHGRPNPIDPSGPGGTSTIKPTTPPENMNCVEQAANKIREEEAANNVNSKLKGYSKNINDDCNKIQAAIKDENGTITIDNKKLKEKFPPNEYSCENVGKDRFDVGKSWNCVNIGRKGKYTCIPHRREHMCIKKINDMMSVTVSDKQKLLEEVMKAAQEEGIDILKKLKPEKQTELYNICDAMKYSFADIGDIIRGRDLLNKYRNASIQTRLKSIFRNIYDKLQTDKDKYTYDHPNYYTLRSDWWNANREDIWKAMTCVAPKEAKFLKKKDTNGTTISSQHEKCGYNKTTPVDDYIPQRFRWLTEWSENYCKGKKKKLDELKGKCETCTKNSSCEDDADGKKCKECKKTCESFTKFVKEWQQQFNIQSKTYKDLYEEANTSSGNPPTSNDQDTKFLQKVKDKCGDDTSSADKYLDKANNCTDYIFENSNNDDYAFKEQPPKPYEDKCKCTVPDPLDKCPKDKDIYDNVCNTFSITKTCEKKTFMEDLDNWNSQDVKNTIPNNKGVLVPPRRRYLCLKYITTKLNSTTNKDNFKKILLEYVFTEGYYLYDRYKKQPTKALEAMKYSFADYGDIIKGNDMLGGSVVDELNKKLNIMFSNNNGSSTDSTDDRKNWWEENKQKVWNVMLCGYQKGKNNHNEKLDQTWCDVPKEDETPQFLRWLEEWATIFCKEKVDEAKTVVKQCIETNKIQSATKIDEIQDNTCKNILEKYKKWYIDRNRQWNGLKDAYEKNKKTNSASSGNLQLPDGAEDYVKNKCSKCDCNYDDLDKISKYQEQQNELLKELKKVAKYDSIDPKNSLFYKFLTVGGKGPEIVKDVIKATPNILQKGIEYGVPATVMGIGTGIGAAKAVATKILDKLIKFINPSSGATSPNGNVTPQPAPPEPDIGKTNVPSPHPVNPQQNDDPMNSIVLSTVPPVGIGVVLGSIALLFYLKIPQNDEAMPTKTSTNRYVPYGRYKGRTYIYMEGDEPDDYLRDISSSDITSSSESEYEEIDLYKPRSPKYKTLIEVVLKPTKQPNDTPSGTLPSDIPNSGTIPNSGEKPFSGDIPIDDEWNELKKDFISNMLQKDIPGNITDTNTSYSGMPLEQPFITQIQDRKLYSDDNEIIYNINWNVPENINRTTNIMDDSKYGSSNDKYSGIDLINDALNSGNDIYDELLKRKENELYGTNYPKNTTTNSVVMEANSDPISNQIDLFNKWLDRHRDMCNQRKNKEEILGKLNDEWNKDNKEHLFYTSTHDDINRINDETHVMINENTHERNDITSVEHLRSTNIPPNDLTTQNNGFRTNTLRSNIFMDIHFDENNNIPRDNDYLESSYNF
ncbi:erythrocyte membrane protein 1, PfEMP1, putative [Plasmodium sp. gorilla clade G2]|uniref:erythrocyte membrane protein 1, PfEMP1, putative n=1 Tax=Plasmodium sp. gorilla clade G2 TaxID=880535 RepID=UPI000D2C0D2A|nr:erythrocyte membrane protein 1, PfEMP1, putative [Plasmodium sp. gorilla clade G2]SOV20422.1 erythrocyte membrane protein 1, PfEMP1, putative [Plasmodium sp. gorilla clade G2]